MTIQLGALLPTQLLLFVILVLSPSVRAASTKALDPQKLLNSSPWAIQVEGTMNDPADEPEISDAVPTTISQAGQPNVNNGNLSTNTRWDGQIGKSRMGHLATIPVVVRWDSARVIQHVLEQQHDADALALTTAAPQNFIISVVGLLPSKLVNGPATLKAKSSGGDDGVQVKTTEEILEWFMGNSLLTAKGQAPIRPQNVKINPETGAVHLFFPRSDAFVAHKHDVQLVTRYGNMNVQAKFHLKDMLVDGKPDL
jgi:hypothetical protein